MTRDERLAEARKALDAARSAASAALRVWDEVSGARRYITVAWEEARMARSAAVEACRAAVQKVNAIEAEVEP